MLNISKLTERDIDRLAQDRYEPRWIRGERTQSWNNFKQMSYPNWRKSKIPKLDLLELTKIDHFSQQNMEPDIIHEQAEGVAGKIIIEDGQTTYLSIKPELINMGVIFCDMKTALLERADLLEKYYANSSWGIDDKLSNFHRALWENGYFLYIPKSSIIDDPFQVRIIQKKANRSVINRNMIIVEQGASISLEELYESKGSQKKQVACFSSTETSVKESAQLHFFSTQNWAEHIYDLSYYMLKAQKNAHISSLINFLGAKEGRVAIVGNVEDEGASIEQNGILIHGNQQKFKIDAIMEHSAANTEGIMKYKSILKDNAYSFMSGLIKILPEANKSKSRLEEEILLLSNDASCDVLPALDIQTNDVQVSHSTSVRQANEENIFYLMSRGLTKKESRDLMVTGFFSNLLRKIKNPEWYEINKNLLEEKLYSLSDKA